LKSAYDDYALRTIAMRILIVGGTNFIGPPLVRRLVELGHKVAVFHRGRTSADLPGSVETIVGDRHRLGDRAVAFRRFGPDVVVDMIAFTERDALGLLEAFTGLARRSVVISSADVYRAYGRFLGIEPGPIEPTPIAEDAPLRTSLFPYHNQAQKPDDFFSSYDKIPVERVVMGEPRLPGTVLRLPMVHGPGDPYRRLSPYLKRMADGRPAVVLGEGLARWKCPRGYVDDVAAAIALAVMDDRAANRVYNVAESVALTEAEWIRCIGRTVGWRGEVVTVPNDRAPTPYRIEQSLDTDSDRIRRELGFIETATPQTALERTIDWDQDNPAGPPQGVLLLDYDTENALLAETGQG
jgi:nucleoside-diphosphate-sugar epimerase